ncbi:MAG: DUF1156 domain-containing protein [Candidatus Poribacteria bacterium]|nr:DUF1156 domain-containing protein [Candidatus Poribacteria bacterium]
MPRRLIEEAFPLKKVSEDSKHEKNVRHGHISTLHIWPARRPLAACRAVTIATLLPDPADAPEKMKAEYTRLAGSPLPEKQRDYLCNDLIASLTRWGDENGHADWNAKDKNGRWLNKLRITRELIRMAYNGDPPKVMDMFAGGGAIPLEAMRLGCKAIANDYNPVAWFILKCTLEYPQRFAGKTTPLPDLNLSEKPDLKNGDFADHVRLWGQWVLENARTELTEYYPVIDNKPTVAYLWARTVPCQDPQCGATVPLLKTLWVCKKAEKTLKDTPENRNRPDFLRLKETRNQTKVVINGKRALKLCPDPETNRVRFEIITPKNEKDVGDPTMSGATATCPFCESQQPTDYIKRCGHEGKLKSQMTTVVYQAEYGKEYRSPTQTEIDKSEIPTEVLKAVANQIPYGMPDEALPESDRSGAGRAFSVPLYGFKKWSDVFTDRQLLALTTFVKWTRAAREDMKKVDYSAEWLEAINGYLACAFDRMLDHSSTLISWITGAEAIGHTFVRYALPMTWDFSEGAIPNGVRGGYQLCLNKILSSLETIRGAHTAKTPNCVILRQSATDPISVKTEAIITDPPYYDAIPYADLSDFFYVWLRRIIGEQFFGISSEPLTPKTSELIQHTGRFEGNNDKAKEFYENGMAKSFQSAYKTLSEDGRIVIVFAHKAPDAWETLVKAMIESGLVVTASWPIDTEQGSRMRAQGSAALATSLWMVCRKRPAKAKAGHYGKVKREMQERITERLRYFWDEGIRGPDFVWAAIGPALESYSIHKEVKRMDGQIFTVTEFLTEVRRMVTDFALGQILHGTSTEALDEWTRYYLMHKDYFGTENAPVGECILLAQGYGVPLDDLRDRHIGTLKKVSSGNALKLLGHTERTSDRIGYAHTSGRIPMIDMIHRVMKLWQESDSAHINAYFHEHGLQENPLFKAVVQALIETSPQGSSDRSLLETLINYEPGEFSGISSSRQSTNETEQQLTMDDILSK